MTLLICFYSCIPSNRGAKSVILLTEIKNKKYPACYFLGECNKKLRYCKSKFPYRYLKTDDSDYW